MRGCRRRGFPALSAIVVKSMTGRPGGGYYASAHPGVEDEAAREAEVERVRAFTYPEQL